MTLNGLEADRNATGSPPLLVADPAAAGTASASTVLMLFPRPGALPAVWAGAVPTAGLEPEDVAALLAAARPCSLLPQHAEGWFGRQGARPREQH